MTDLIRPKHLRPRAPVPKPHCAFCGRTEGQVPILITGKEARICNECVRVAAKQLDDASPFIVHAGVGSAAAGGGFGLDVADGGGCKAMLPCDAAAAARAVTGFPTGGGGGGGILEAADPAGAAAAPAACAFRCAKRASSWSMVIDSALILFTPAYKLQCKQTHRQTNCCGEGRRATT